MAELTLADVLQELRSDIRQMGQDIRTGLKDDLDRLKHEFDDLKQDVEALKHDVATLKVDAATPKVGVKDTKINVNNLTQELVATQKWQHRTWDVIKWVGAISAGLSISASIAIVGILVRTIITGI